MRTVVAAAVAATLAWAAASWFGQIAAAFTL